MRCLRHEPYSFASRARSMHIPTPPYYPRYASLYTDSSYPRFWCDLRRRVWHADTRSSRDQTSDQHRIGSGISTSRLRPNAIAMNKPLAMRLQAAAGARGRFGSLRTSSSPVSSGTPTIAPSGSSRHLTRACGGCKSTISIAISSIPPSPSSNPATTRIHANEHGLGHL